MTVNHSRIDLVYLPPTQVAKFSLKCSMIRSRQHDDDDATYDIDDDDDEDREETNPPSKRQATFDMGAIMVTSLCLVRSPYVPIQAALSSVVGDCSEKKENDSVLQSLRDLLSETTTRQVAWCLSHRGLLRLCPAGTTGIWLKIVQPGFVLSYRSRM